MGKHHHPNAGGMKAPPPHSSRKVEGSKTAWIELHHSSNFRTFPYGVWKNTTTQKKSGGASSLSSWPTFQTHNAPTPTSPQPHQTTPHHAAHKINYDDNIIRFITITSWIKNMIIRSIMIRSMECQMWRGRGAKSHRCFKSFFGNFSKIFKPPRHTQPYKNFKCQFGIMKRLPWLFEKMKMWLKS